MAEGKKGFILYADLIHTVKQLSDVKAGQLLKHILKYVNDENPKSNDQILNLVFEPIKQQLKRDLKHWEDIREKRSIAGKKGGRPKKQIKANKANDFFDKQTKAKKAVIVNDNVKVNESDINNARSFTILEKFKDHVFKEAKELHIEDSITIKFLEHWTERDFDSGLFAWQVPETFIIRSRLKGWLNGTKKETKSNFIPPT